MVNAADIIYSGRGVPEDWQEIAENCPADFRQYVPQDLFTQELDRALEKNV